MPVVYINFNCRVCGKECDVAPDPPARAICEDCCTHENGYVYDTWYRNLFCKDCFKQKEED